MKELENEISEDSDKPFTFKEATIKFEHFKKALEKIKSSKQRLKQTQIQTEGTATEFY